MLDLGWSELLVIGVVALIVVGPKDLPVLFRNIGRFVGKAKGMAREFSRAMNDAADDAGVSDLQKTLRAATNPVSTAMDGVKDAAKTITLDPDSETGKLAAEKDAQRKKIEASAARAAANRKKREAEEAAKKAEALEAELASDTAPATDDAKDEK
ncbi:Sec-independent protein translocase protein TatB [Mesobacterium sp. TK19101]|uniref:Sec-independent protein translocase protein TatB n=1 Tax=Mesobacterium hydrothermale TaxID=3111907 RepID=A0ABU6HGT9_9RHOB|nr:Sec-independent protein translocase protein TatB [Mesobacterium sp. TK19101]MEC3861677.1 Sec-independent protein translocase protein TatB [Mesobacterium sp. TK19101]